MSVPIDTVPAQKTARMTSSRRRSAVERKRSKAQGVGGKPTNVSTLEKNGKKVYPSSKTLKTIQNKSKQKDFYINLPHTFLKL
mgnify:CR=1 FL=1